jgi:hypothetical protein
MVGKPTLALFPSYQKAILNSVGSNLFRNLYFRINGEVVDVLENGDLSCASFVTHILYLYGLIGERHVTVAGTVRDMSESGWYEIPEPREGALILWDLKKQDDSTQGKHQHLGFYIDAETAISNSSSERTIVRHHPTYGMFGDGEAQRDVLAYYWHNKLD